MNFSASPSGHPVGIELTGVTGSTVTIADSSFAGLYTVARPAGLPQGAFVVGGDSGQDGVGVSGGRVTDTQLHVSLFNATGATVTVSTLSLQFILTGA